MEIDGRFWLKKDGRSFLGSGRIELLNMIEKTGSINAAAKEMKMSYKAAWERINGMNELADEPIIQRKIGGKGGGGTTLTPYAHELIKTYDRLNELHRQFIDRFSEAGDSPELLSKILKRTFLTTSARNQIPSKISKIDSNELSSLITITLSGGSEVLSTITSKSANSMNLHVGSDIYAIIKSSDIKIYAAPPKETKDLNLLEGTVESLESTDLNSELALRINEKTLLITLLKKDEMDSFSVGKKAYAGIAYNNIIVGL
ncbi:TOBE domain-containing protein [Sulfurimonas sp. HSL-1716]|uniref:TOBE domain-containing protein n=1 Tax=Hydrocurvibacter sulfurireducens TaxID=3131937 RepID=UPI0031F98EE7